MNRIYTFQYESYKFHQEPFPVSLILNLDMVTGSCFVISFLVCTVSSQKKIDHHVTRRDLQVLIDHMKGDKSERYKQQEDS